MATLIDIAEPDSVLACFTLERAADGWVWSTALNDFEADTPSNVTNYAIDATETSPGTYLAANPAASVPCLYKLIIKASPDLSELDRTDGLRATGFAGPSGLDASGIRAAIGMADANLDAQIAAIGAQILLDPSSKILADSEGRVAVSTLGPVPVTLVADALDTIIVATGITGGRFTDTNSSTLTQLNLRQAMAILLTATLGDRSGISSRTISSTIPGTGMLVAAERNTRTTIVGTVIAPA